MSEATRWKLITAMAVLLVWSRLQGGGVPFVPEVTPGTRAVVILHESADQTPEFGALIVELRRKGGTAQSYLAGKGHSLYILDDDLPNKWQLAPRQVPALFILDDTENVLFEQAIPATYTADQVIERLRENGG